jgi:hypothetical protein
MSLDYIGSMRMFVEIFVAILLGLSISVFSYRNPKQLNVTVFGIAIATSGLVLGSGHALWDEWLFLSALVGALLAKTHQSFNTKVGLIAVTRHLELTPLILLLLYMSSVAAVSTLNYLDWQLLRWVGFYLTLVIFVFLQQVVPQSKRDLSFVTLIASLLWFVMYALHFFVLEYVFKFEWEGYQNVTLTGSAYASFGAVVALPLAIYKMTSTDWRVRCVCCAIVFLTSVSTQLYSSRALLICCVVAIAVSLFTLRFKHLVITICLSLAGQFVGHSLNPRAMQFATPKAWAQEVVSSALLPIHAKPTDQDRASHTTCAAHLLISGTTAQALFGYGQDQHKKAMLQCPELKRFLHPQQIIVRSSALSAYVINYGFVGLFLLLMAIFHAIKRASSRLERKAKVIWLPFFVLALCWSLIVDYRDNLIFWLLLMGNLPWLGAKKTGLNLSDKVHTARSSPLATGAV